MSWEVDLDGQGGGDDGEGAGGLPGFLADPRGVLKRRWRWMVPIVLVGLVLTGVYLKRRQDVYTARATVLIASQRISGALIPIAETDQLEKVSAIVGELLSRRNLTALIEKHGLYPPTDKGEELPLDKKVGIMRAVTRIAIDDSNTANMNRESTATVFEIFYTSLDPQKAADVANDLARGFTDAHLDMRNKQARLTTEFLRRERDRTAQELAQLESEITQFKQTHRGELPSELVMNLGRLDRLQSQRQSLALQIAEAESRLATLAASGTDVDPDSPEALLRSLQNRYKEQRAIYTEDHPNVVSLANRIANLQAEIARRGGTDGPTVSTNAASAARLTLEELRRQLAETVAEYDGLDRRVGLVPQVQEELAAMEGRAEVLRESHREFMRKVQQAELAEAVESAQQGERATVLDPAVPPSRAESSPFKMLAVMIVGSFGAAISFAILLELIDPVVVGIGDIEQKYRLPVLGSVAPLQ